MSDSPYTIRVATSLAGVDPAQWDACANPEPGSQPPESLSEEADSISQKERFNPFISHAFLNCCEAPGSASARTGWSPATLRADLEAAGFRVDTLEVTWDYDQETIRAEVSRP